MNWDQKTGQIPPTKLATPFISVEDRFFQPRWNVAWAIQDSISLKERWMVIEGERLYVLRDKLLKMPEGIVGQRTARKIWMAI